MRGEEHLLSDEQVRAFIVDGYVQVQTDLNESVHRTIFEKTDRILRSGAGGRDGGGANPQNNILPVVGELARVLEAPEVVGALTSLLGHGYVMLPHRHCHLNAPVAPLADGRRGITMVPHRDGQAGCHKPRHRVPQWALLFYYPQECPDRQGPTALIPGTHLLPRLTSELDLEMPLAVDPGADGGYRLPANLRAAAGDLPGVRPRRGIDHALRPGPLGAHQHRRRNALRAQVRVHAHRTAGTSELGQPGGRTGALRAPPGGTAPMNTETVKLPGPTSGTGCPAPATCFVARRPPPRRAGRGSIADLVRRLRSGGEDDRLQAANALGFARAAAAPAIGDLIAALEDVSPQVQLAACYALAAVGAAAVDPLVAALDGYEELYRGYPPYGIGHAAHALGAIGAPAVPALAQALCSPHDHVRANAAYALGEMGHRAESALDALAEALGDSEEEVRRHLLSAVSLVGHPPERALAVLAGALQRETDSQLRQLAIQGMTRLDGPQDAAVPALAAALSDSDPYVAAYASEQLCRIATPAALAAAVGHLRRLRWFADAPRLEPELAQARQRTLAVSRVVGRH